MFFKGSGTMRCALVVWMLLAASGAVSADAIIEEVPVDKLPGVETKAPQVPASAPGAATHFKIEKNDVLAEAVIDELAKQAGIEIAKPGGLFADAPAIVVNVSIDADSLDRAIEQLAEQTGFYLRWTNGLRFSVSTRALPTRTAPVVKAPPAVSAVIIERVSTVRQRGFNRDSRAPATIQLRVQCADSLIAGDGMAVVSEAIDQDGNPVEVRGIPVRHQPPRKDLYQPAEPKRIVLPRLPDSITSIKKLKGDYVYHVPQTFKRITLKALDKGDVSVQINGETVRFSRPTLDGNGWALKASIPRLPGANEDGNSVNNRFRWLCNSIYATATTKDGVPLQIVSGGTNTSEKTEILYLQFALQSEPTPLQPTRKAIAEPVEFIWYLPEETIEKRIPFEFHNIVVP